MAINSRKRTNSVSAERCENMAGDRKYLVHVTQIEIAKTCGIRCKQKLNITVVDTANVVTGYSCPFKKLCRTIE